MTTDEASLMERSFNRRSVLRAAGALPAFVAAGSLLGTVPADAAARVLGTITIPRIGLRRSVFSDALEPTLARRGVGLYRGSALPGERGVALIFGHRTTHGGPFRRTNELRKYDTVMFVSHRYLVHSLEVVSSADLRDALKWSPVGHKRGAMLISCSKRSGAPTSTSYRLLVKLVG